MGDRTLKAYLARIIRWAVTEGEGLDEGDQQVQHLRYLGHPGTPSAAAYCYGFTALAPNGSQNLILMVGEQENRAHIPMSSKDRPRMKSGEVAVYHPGNGNKLHFKDDGTIEIVGESDVNTTAEGNVVFSTPLFVVIAPTSLLIGDVQVTGEMEIDGDLNHDGANAGFRASAPVAKPVVTGSTGAIIPLQEVLAALDLQGLIDDQST